VSIQIGRVFLNESAIRPFDESQSGDERTVTLSGILFNDSTHTEAAIKDLHDDIMGLPLSIVPVIFGDKSDRNGYYTVLGSKSSIVNLAYQSVIQLTWAIDLRREGNDQEVDLETRLAGPVNRLNDFTLSGSRWLGVPVGATGFLAGASTPSIVNRPTPDGTMPVFTGISGTVNSVRYQCDITDYGKGRVMVKSDGRERAGIGVSLGSTNWELSNGLLRLTARASGFSLAYYSGGVWETARDWNFLADGGVVAVPTAVSVLRNDYEQVTLRLMWNRTPSGRVVADVTLRRGSHFVEFVMKSNTATTFELRRATNEAGTSASGFVRATSNDAQGDRYVVGSSRTFTANLGTGGLSKASTTRLDVMLGIEINGTTAIAGDTGADLMAQYLGSPTQVVLAVRR
jgi:hypothetical protein